MGTEPHLDPHPRVTAATWAVTPEKIAAVVARLAAFAHPSRAFSFRHRGLCLDIGSQRAFLDIVRNLRYAPRRNCRIGSRNRPRSIWGLLCLLFHPSSDHFQ